MKIELPEFGDPQWEDNDRDSVIVDQRSYPLGPWLDAKIGELSESLARALAAQQFAEAEAEKAKWDCAAERAYNAFYSFAPVQDLWEHLTPRVKELWMKVARAAVEG